MPNKIEWSQLNHQQKVKILAEMSIDQIVNKYGCVGLDEGLFRQQLVQENKLWNPKNVAGFKTAGQAPTKDVVLGAWRDLERAEALLELIDNSIDEWLRRRAAHPKKTSKELNIFIDIDPTVHQLTYEDNAGGVSTDRLENLVVPGFSDTTAVTRTIGSYKTGGKKAVFRLAKAAQITTRYWNPAETTDEAVAVQLDEQWINNSRQYEFSYATLRQPSVVEKGQTRYLLQLREEPIGGTPWFEQPAETDKIVSEIRSAYTLLSIRNPDIHIYFRDRTQPLEPLEDLYEFSGASDANFDIRPQAVVFKTQLLHEGQNQKVEIEVVLGCRKTSGVRSGRTGGIDLYGNNRLFVPFDHTLFSELLPSGQVRNMVRGFVNIKGPNVFIPWDTHKRHLNTDRDIISVITKHPLIKRLFENWKEAYLTLSRTPEVSKIVAIPLPKAIDRAAKDLFIPHRAEISLDIKRKRGVALPTAGFFVPKVPARRRRRNGIAVTLTLSTSEARLLSTYYGIQGDPISRTTRGELALEIKNDLLKRAAK